MAITQESLLVNIEVQTGAAVASLGKMNDQFDALRTELEQFKAPLKKTEDAFGGLGFVALKFNAALELAQKGYEKFIEPLKESIKAYQDAQESGDKLGRVLRGLGDNDVDGTIKRFKDLGDELVKTTTVEDEMVNQLAAMGKSLGLTNDQTEKMIKTSIDLSAVTGNDVQTSFQSLEGTLKGNARAVGALGILINGLSEDELRAGKGIDVLGERFKGFGEEVSKSLPGVLKNITREIGEIQKDIGEIINKGFSLPESAKEELAFLQRVRSELDQLKPKLVETILAIRQFFAALVEGFKSVDWVAIAEGAVAFGAAIAIAFAPAIYAAAAAAIASLGTALAAMATALVANVAAAAALAAPVIAVTAVVLVLASAADLLYHNFGLVAQLIDKGLVASLDLFKKAMISTALSIVESLSTLVQGAGSAFSVFSGTAVKAMNALTAAHERLANSAMQTNDAFAGSSKELVDLAANSTVNMGITGKIIAQGTAFLDGFNKKMGETAKVVDETDKQTKNKPLANFGKQSEEAKKALDEVIKKIQELESERDKIGKSDGQLIAQRVIDQNKELKLMEDKLRLQRLLTPEIQKQFDIGRKTIAQTAVLATDELRKKNLKDINDGTIALARTVAEIDATTMERIEMERAAAIAAINARQTELARDKEINAEAIAALEAQKELVNLKAKADNTKAPGQNFEAAKQVGTDLAGSITQAFQSGATGAVTGMLTGVGEVVQAAQAIVDFVPGLLDSISHLFDSITELPLKIAASLQNLFASLLKYIQSYLPNLIKSISTILLSAINFLTQLPDVFTKMIDQLPDLILNLLNQLPALIEKLVASLEVVMPKLAIALINVIIARGPQISLAIAKSLAIDLPIAILLGLRDALKEVGGDIANLIKGNLPKIGIDTQAIGNAIKSVTNKLTGETSKLFNVSDLTSAVTSPSKALADLADKVTQSLVNGLKAIKDAWQWVYDHILAPLGGLVSKAWQWVYDHVLAPIGGIVSAAWQWVYDKVIQPLFDGLKAVWSAIYDNVLKPFITVLQAVWQGVFDIAKATWGALFDAGGKVLAFAGQSLGILFDIWTKALGAVFDVAKTIFKVITDTFGTVFDAIKKIFDTITGTFKEVFNDITQKGLGGVVDAFKAVFNSAKTIFDTITKALGDVFNIYLDGWKKIAATIAGLGGQVYDSLKTALASGSNIFFSIGTQIWNGLKAGLGNIGAVISDALGGATNVFDKIFHIDPDQTAVGRGGVVENTLGFNIPFVQFAKGIVPGQAKTGGDSYLNDTILSLYSPGEAVIPRSKMQDPAVRRIIELIMSGQMMPSMFAYGINDLKKSASAIAGNVAGSAQSLGGALSQAFKDSGVADLLGNLDPSLAWKRAKEEALNVVMRAFQKNRFESGGATDGGPTYTDPGEFVMRREAVSNYGLPFMASLNSGQAPTGQAAIYNNTVNLNITTTQPIDGDLVRAKVMPIVRAELKRASADGRTVVYNNGVRSL